MGVRVITESGDEFELPPEIIAESDATKIDAYVAKLNAPPKPSSAKRTPANEEK